MRDVEGKVAVITGGGSGIGRATALALARRGATVAICGLPPAAGAGHVFFQENVGIAEGGAGLAAGLVESVVELVGGEGDAHAPAAAAHRRLDDDRVAELFGDLARLRLVANRRVAACKDRHLRLVGNSPGGNFDSS